MYEIQELTDESTHNYVILNYENDTRTMSISFDYAVPVSNGERDNRIALYKENSGPSGTFHLDSIDESKHIILEIMLDSERGRKELFEDN